MESLLVSSYNPSVLGDALIVVTNSDGKTQKSEKKGQVVKITNNKDQPIGYNFFDIAKDLNLTDKNNGQVFLDDKQVETLNSALNKAGFNDKIKADLTPKFVVGYVKEIKKHPDSDHLHICQVELDDGKMQQIVCGAKNIDKDQKVVVAKVGAMMPNGKIIFPGKLRGVESDGMICSAHELGDTKAPVNHHILVLGDDYQIGAAFDLSKLN